MVLLWLMGHLHSGVAVVMVVDKCNGKVKRVREKGEGEEMEGEEEEEEEEERCGEKGDKAVKKQ